MEWWKQNWKGVASCVAFFGLIAGTMVVIHAGPDYALSTKVAAMDFMTADEEVMGAFNARQAKRNQRLSDMRVEINRMYEEMIEDYRKTFGRDPNIPLTLPDGQNDIPEAPTPPDMEDGNTL